MVRVICASKLACVLVTGAKLVVGVVNTPTAQR